MTFGNIDILTWIAAGVLAACFLFQLYWYARYMAAPARKMRRDKANVQRNNVPCTKDELPPVSVILCAHNESENLSNYLQALLSQDYPEFEVIVVDDGSEDDTRQVIEQYMAYDNRLRKTFVPYGARVRSTKKLALTLAAKAARYDYLLLTDADCRPESAHWISEMVKGFRKTKDPRNDQMVNDQMVNDIVLGFGAYFYEKGHVNRLVRYDTLFNGLHYLGAALCGHPYMGVGRNLAYRKSLFFESGGFTHLMTNRAGDDDLFVNHVATRKNTAVVVSRESLTWSPAKETLREWLQQKRRHLSVSPLYRESTKARLTVEPVTRGLFYAALLVMVIRYCLGWSGWAFGAAEIIACGAVGLFLFRWILQTAVINISARRMGLPRFNMLSVLWFDIVLPLVSAWMLIVPKKNNKW